MPAQSGAETMLARLSKPDGEDMQDRLTQAYARYGRRYPLLVIAFATGRGAIIAIPLAMFFPMHLYAGNWGAYWRTVLVADAGLLVATLLGIAVNRRLLRPLTAWCGGERTALLAAQVLRAAQRIPWTVTVSVFAFGVLTVVAPSTLVMLHEVDGLNAGNAAGLLLAALPVAVYIVVLGWFLLDLGLRPVVSEAVGYAVGEVPATRGLRVSIAVKLGIGLATATLIAAETIGLYGEPRGAGTRGAVRELLRAGVVSAVFLVTIGLGMALIVLGPVRDLIRGTRAVAADNLDVRIPVTSGDELGELAASFNAMVAGLRERAGLRDELRASQERIVASGNLARRKVERDLHDGAQQHLVLMRLKLGLLERQCVDPQLADLVSDVATDLDRALHELRNLARGIYPSQLEAGGLAAALREVAVAAAIPVHIATGALRRYPPELEAGIYFCCLEALQNAAKHAGDDAEATVHIGERAGLIEFQVRDNGRGFDTSAPTRPTGGVQNIIDRVGALGGCVAVHSGPGKGTVITGSIPISALPVSAATDQDSGAGTVAQAATIPGR